MKEAVVAYIQALPAPFSGETEEKLVRPQIMAEIRTWHVPNESL
jgi:hypothetical protein